MTRSRPFRLEPEAEDFLGAIGAHAQRDMHSFVANQPFVADLDPQRVEENQRINCFQRAGLPEGNLLQHRVGDRADQIRRNLDAVEIAQMTDDLARSCRGRTSR